MTLSPYVDSLLCTHTTDPVVLENVFIINTRKNCLKLMP